MPNKYKYNHTFEELREEEDREVYNDYLRAKTQYYETVDNINYLFFEAMKMMTMGDIVETIKNGGLKCPVQRL